MFKRLTFLALVLSMVCVALFSGAEVRAKPASAEMPYVPSKNSMLRHYGNLPLSFISNNGQINAEIAYFEKGSGHATYFTKKGIYLELIKDSKKNEAAAPAHTSQIIKLFPVGANGDPELFAENLQAGKVNYFLGNNPERWQSHVPSYGSVVYKELYEGIDLRFYGNNRTLEYDVIVQPGIDPSVVQFAYEGIKGLAINASGALEIFLEDGKLLQKKPYLYQEIAGNHVQVDGAFQLVAANRTSKNESTTDSNPSFSYRFEVAPYNKAFPLIIDPILDYATYLGGSEGGDSGTDIAVDGEGNAYVVGVTSSSDFLTLSLWPSLPPSTTLQKNISGGIDTFVTKFDPTGRSILYSTFLGGSSTDEAAGIAVDQNGNAYITGKTLSSDFPLFSPIQASRPGGTDAFLTKIDASGGALAYSTYIGGNLFDASHGIALDEAGNVYITGETNSSNFPTLSPIQAHRAGSGSNFDAFITKINASGSGFIYSTYLGGDIHDYAYGIAVDSEGNASVTGKTGSFNFPLLQPIQESSGGNTDVFVSKLNVNGDALLYSTYLGGINEDEAYDIAVDRDGNAYVSGRTFSNNFPTISAFQRDKKSAWDAFVTKVNATGSALIYSTYLGGNGNDAIYGIAVDPFQNVYLTGETASTDFPMVSSLQETHAGGGNDAFITKMNAAGTALIYSSYHGGSGFDKSHGIAIDGKGSVYLTGETRSVNFPVVFNRQNWIGGGTDAFVSKISDTLSGPEIRVTDSGAPDNDLRIVFGDVAVGAVSIKTVTINNDGTADLNLGLIAGVDLLAAPFSIVNDHCSRQTVLPLARCTFDLHFSPTAVTNTNDTLDIPSNDPDENPVIIHLNGTGTALSLPKITVSDTVLPSDDFKIPFGSINTGTFSIEQVSLKNEGNAPLVLGALAKNNVLAAPFRIQTDHCSNTTLAPSSNCTFEIHFSPSSGISNDSFDIPSNDPNHGSLTFDVNGTGISSPSPDLRLRDSDLPENDFEISFGDIVVGRVVEETITIANTGSAVLVLGPIAQSDPIGAPFALLNDNCSGRTLASLQTCTFNIHFLPEVAGIFNEVFDLPSNDPDHPSQTFRLNGVGQPALLNHPPSKTKLLFPANGQQGLSDNLTFRWEQSVDPDGDPVSYTLFVCEDPNPLMCAPTLEAALAVGTSFAAFSYGVGFFLVGIVFFTWGNKRSAGERTGRWGGMLLLAGMVLAACSSSGGNNVPAGAGTNSEISRPAQTLRTGTQYFWTVLAKDGKGGETQSDVWHFTTQ